MIILRFHLFVSLLPFLVQSGLWCLQIIASFEEHFSVLQSHTQPPPWIWVFVFSNCTVSGGSLYDVVFSDIIIIITIIIIIICLSAAVVPPMESTTDNVFFGLNKVVK